MRCFVPRTSRASTIRRGIRLATRAALFVVVLLALAAPSGGVARESRVAAATAHHTMLSSGGPAAAARSAALARTGERTRQVGLSLLAAAARTAAVAAAAARPTLEAVPSPAPRAARRAAPPAAPADEPPAAPPSLPSAGPPAEPTPAAPPPAPACPAATMSPRARDLFDAINGERTAAGLPALTFDSCLTFLAQHRTDDMASRNYFAHVSPDGESLGTLLDAYAIDFAIAAENLARNNAPDADAANLAITELMASERHRANILSNEVTLLGVGETTDATGMKYFAMVFLGH